jgi:DNA-directed RNA polymerase specialized sigma24 family protein
MREKAQDLVHDFCLHFTVTKPDLSGISNLDGYLYKSLRNIYLSGLPQSSREALQLVNIAEFDSIQLAFLPSQIGDSLQRQNDWLPHHPDRSVAKWRDLWFLHVTPPKYSEISLRLRAAFGYGDYWNV